MTYFSGKKVVVAGGAGFLGSYVVEKLGKLGCADVFVPRSTDYDLTVKENVERLFDDIKPDIVINLCAKVGGIGANMKYPGTFFYDNLMMGTNIMEESRRRKIEKTVNVGTICSYPNDTPVPFREEDLWMGYPEETNAPYGLAKKMLIVQSKAYEKQYGLGSINLLLVNLYGPRDNFDPESSHVIPALIKKFYEATHEPGGKEKEQQDEVVVWGTGAATREFLYVEDAADAIVKATCKYDKTDPVNIGAGFEISIRELAQKIGDTLGYEKDIKWDTSKPDGQPRRCLDTTKAADEFGWKAKTGFDEGLEKTIRWYVKEMQAQA